MAELNPRNATLGLARPPPSSRTSSPAARAPHDPWAARLSSTKQVGRPFLGSINALPAVAETMRARAEVILAATPAVGQRLGRAHHHRVVATVTVALTAAIAENSTNVHLPLENWPAAGC